MKKFSSSFRLRHRWISLGVLCGLFMGCGEDPRQIFDTARFEEQQQNRAHAQELYEQLILQYPDSEFAEKARQRLETWKGETSEGVK